jgi:hypothetical protein
MYETETAPIFSATDTDGDTLAIESFGPSQYAFTVAGEDGHRTVLLSDDDVARLTELLATIAPIHRG